MIRKEQSKAPCTLALFTPLLSISCIHLLLEPSHGLTSIWKCLRKLGFFPFELVWKVTWFFKLTFCDLNLPIVKMTHCKVQDDPDVWRYLGFNVRGIGNLAIVSTVYPTILRIRSGVGFKRTSPIGNERVSHLCVWSHRSFIVMTRGSTACEKDVSLWRNTRGGIVCSGCGARFWNAHSAIRRLHTIRAHLTAVRRKWVDCSFSWKSVVSHILRHMLPKWQQPYE